ncbi:MAG: enoyl-CoA hydratase-related protein, partial [Burkholderiaceae bacterium]
NRSKDPSNQRASIDQMHEWITAIRECPKPVIAAVEGAAAGAGFSLVMACDQIIAADNARFIMAYIKVGLTPDGGGTFFLGTRLPYQTAYELIARGQPIGAARLHAMGVVNEVCPAGSALATALTRAAELADGPAFALGRCKSLLAASERDTLAHQLVRERENFVAALFHADAGEGMDAFLGKRPPRFNAPAPDSAPDSAHDSSRDSAHEAARDPADGSANER